MSRHDELDARDREIARRTVQCGVLEARVWELRAELARAQRHRGALTGLLRGALKDGALAGDYVELAQRVLEQIGAQTTTAPRPQVGREAVAEVR